MENQKLVSWQTFVWAIGIILILFGITFTLVAKADSKADSSSLQVYQIREDISEIKTDIKWIKDKIN